MDNNDTTVASGAGRQERIEPAADNHCIGCGGGNARGLRLGFTLDHGARSARGEFCLGADYQGASGVMHGGIIALLFDEAMGKLTRLYGVRAVTAELAVAYVRPVPAESAIAVEAFDLGREGRNLKSRAELRSSGGEVLARATARFVVIAER